jgi:hypothetical protein
MTTEPRAARAAESVPTIGTAQAAPPKGSQQPQRRDQKCRCGRCGGFKVPAVKGVKERSDGIYSYRECRDCGFSFVTMRRHGETAENLVG